MIYAKNASIQSYVHGMLSKLWKKGYAVVETCRVMTEDPDLEQSLKLSAEEEEVYRMLRRSLVVCEAECDKSHTESRNRVCVSGYEMPRNFSWIVPLFLSGMSTPKSRDDIVALERLGIKTVITLTEEEPLPTEWFSGTEVENHFWPVTNYYPPCVGHADKFIEMIVTSLESPKAGGTIVHCGGGKGRAGSLLAIYMLRFGLSVPPRPCGQCREKPALWCSDSECAFGTYPAMNAAEVIALLREMRPGSIETERQERFLAEYSSTMYKRMASQKRVMGIMEEESTVPGMLKVEGDPNMRPRLIILMGLPGSGKSSFAQTMEKYSTNWLRLSQDDMGGRDAFERSLGPALKSMGRSMSVILDRCNPTCDERMRWKSMLENPDATAIVWFDASAETCINRVQQRFDHQTLPPHAAKTVIPRFAKQMEPPSLSADRVRAIYRVSTLADTEVLLKHFGIHVSKDVSEQFFKYHRTRHLYDIGGATRDDLVFSDGDASAFLNVKPPNKICIEEKIDGANFGIRLAPDGNLICQNRSHVVNPASHRQFALMNDWLYRQGDALRSILSSGNILFGEWMAAKHSILYDRLPDLFIAFDLFDTMTQRYYSRERFHEVLGPTSIAVVPAINVPAKLDRDFLSRLLQEQSAFSSHQRREGVIIRVDSGDFLLDKAKIVRSDFIAGDEHWSKGLITYNKVVGRK